MRNFISKLIVLGIIIGALWMVQYQAVEAGLKHLPGQVRPMWDYQKRFVHSHTPGQHARTLVTGDSRAWFGILPDRLGKDAVSIALPATRPLEGYYLLADYLDHHPAPERVVLSYAPTSWGAGLTGFWDQACGFKFLSLPRCFEVLYRYHRLRHQAPMLTYDFWNDCLKSVLYAVNYFPLYRNGMLDVLFGPGFVSPSNILTDQRLRAQSMTGGEIGKSPNLRSDDPKHLVKLQNMPSKSLQIEYFVRTLRLCESRGIQIVYMTSPVYEAVFSGMAESFKRDIKTIIETSVGSVKGVRTFYRTDIPSYPAELFADGSHLNREGAVRFTSEIADLMLPELAH
jgi:hypothetical protein